MEMLYAWFKEILSWPIGAILINTKIVDSASSKKIANETKEKIIKIIEDQCAKITPEQTGLVALDWLNGRRTPFADQRLKGTIAGLSLGTTAPKIYRSLAEATAFGSRAIIERFRQDSLKINEVITIGGIPKKSPLVMQILADVLAITVKVAESSQTVALGAAIFAAVASGYYKSIYEAQEHLSSKILKIYYPDKKNVESYKKLYGYYRDLGKTLERR